MDHSSWAEVNADNIDTHGGQDELVLLLLLILNQILLLSKHPWVSCQQFFKVNLVDPYQ